MFGRHTTLVGRIMAAVALFTLLTGASEEHGGVIVHVELAYADHPTPQGVADWDDVIPNDATGPRYKWAPTGWVIVQRTDGTFVRAWNEFEHARYLSRVSIMQSRDGGWRVTGVDDWDEETAPAQPKPSEETTLIAGAAGEGDERDALTGAAGEAERREVDREEANAESPAARRRRRGFEAYLAGQSD